MIRLSIIIPFYNVEKYIAQCLDSVFAQDISEEEYEVICVNDASPDNSRDIVINYQNEHKNLILIEHKQNKKLGAARNTGRAIARGKYIWNVDSDDYIAENCFSSILNRCEQNNLDILMFNNATNTESVIKEAEFPFYINVVPQDGLTCLNQNILSIGHLCPVWRYIYSINFLNKYTIKSPEINMGEDVPFALQSLLLAKNVLLIDEVYYYYRINPASLTGVSILKPNVLYEKCFVAARLVYDLLTYVPKRNYELIKVIKNMIRYIVYMYPNYCVKMSKKDMKIFSKICRQQALKDFCLFLLMNKSHKIAYIKCLLNI